MGASELPGWHQKGESLRGMDTILLQSGHVSLSVVPADGGKILEPPNVELHA